MYNLVVKSDYSRQYFKALSLFSFEVVQVLHDKLLDMVGKIQ